MVIESTRNETVKRARALAQRKGRLEQGVHFIEVALNEVPLFIKKGKQIPLCKPAMRTSELNTEDLTYIG